MRSSSPPTRSGADHGRIVTTWSLMPSLDRGWPRRCRTAVENWPRSRRTRCGQRRRGRARRSVPCPRIGVHGNDGRRRPHDGRLLASPRQEFGTSQCAHGFLAGVGQLNDQGQPGPGWTVVLRRRPARASSRVARKAATPTSSRSSAATAVMIPAWTTVRSRPRLSGSAGPTPSRRASPHTSNTSGSTLGLSEYSRQAATRCARPTAAPRRRPVLQPAEPGDPLSFRTHHYSLTRPVAGGDCRWPAGARSSLTSGLKQGWRTARQLPPRPSRRSRYSDHDPPPGLRPHTPVGMKRPGQAGGQGTHSAGRRAAASG